MKRHIVARLFAPLMLLGIWGSNRLFSQTINPPVHAEVNQSLPVSQSTVTWQSNHAKHIFGLPDVKANKSGTLVLNDDSLTFTSKAANAVIDRKSITAVSAGKERVELWGLTGRILKFTLPYNTDIAASALMQHRIDMLTVEFVDVRGAGRSAVFFLPANEAEHALYSLAPAAKVAEAIVLPCDKEIADPKSILVLKPNWDSAEVPAAYRSLVYEHLIDRLKHVKNAGRVYRAGEKPMEAETCAQYTMRMSIKLFREGSSVKRTILGPLGNFVGTTQMKFDVNIVDMSGRGSKNEEIKATVRGEEESTHVADHVAKSAAKRYSKLLEASTNTTPSKAHID